MIKKEWLHKPYMLLLIMVFFNVLLSGFLYKLVSDTIVLSLVTIGLSSLLIGAFYGYIFATGINSKLRLDTGIYFIVLQILIVLVFFWKFFMTAESIPLSVFALSIGLSLIYLAEIYYFLQWGAAASSYLIYYRHLKKPVLKTTDRKTVKKTAKKATKKKKK
ncbi:MAG: hypothetical protein WC471_05335 [Candidatus Woesearchaeota archaeon]